MDKSDDSRKCCLNCNSNINTNCNYEACLPIIKEADLENYKCVPLNLNKIVDCTQINKQDIGINNFVTFTVENTNNITYSENSPVCITNIGITYDYLGLHYVDKDNDDKNALDVGTTEVFVDGELFFFTPENIFQAGSDNQPYNLFNILSKSISLRNHCCCNKDFNNGPRLIRINETKKGFQVYNMVLKASGYIGCQPFTATASIDDISTSNDGMVRLSTLGIVSAISYNAKLCIPDPNSIMTFREVFTPELLVECIRPVSNSILDTGDVIFTANVDFLFNVSKNIYILNKEKLNVYSCGK